MSRAAASAAVALLTSFPAPALAQRFAGIWDGIAVGQRLTVMLDSTAAGWRGAAVAPGVSPDTFALTAVVVRGDSVELQVPADKSGTVLRGRIAADRTELHGLVALGPDLVGTFRLARPGSPAAARILTRLPRPIPTGPPRTWSDPDSIQVITSDVGRFWEVFDRAPPDSLEAWLERDYLDAGSQGLRDFIPGRILSADELGLQVRLQRARYLAVRDATVRAMETGPAIRTVFRALKDAYPEAVFPNVYFLIGRFNSGGTASPAGLLIGAEMFDDPALYPWVVAHELIHFQQPPVSGTRTLLVQSLREGVASFVAELITGQRARSESHTYGMAHERELWAEFVEQRHGTSFAGWLYGDPPGERPADLGYFIGYRIAGAYYEKAADKRAALREIILAADPEAILSRSGYAP
jgi:hypothetical protein